MVDRVAGVAVRAAGAAEDNHQGLMQGNRMKQAETTRLFVLICIAVLFASYVVGLGVRSIRFAGAAKKVAAAADTEKPAEEPQTDDTDEVVADADVSSGPPQVWAEVPHEEPAEEIAARPKRSGGGAQMVVTGLDERTAMAERFHNMSGQEKAKWELQAKRAKQDEENLKRVQEMWPDMDEQTRGKIRGIVEKWPNMSEEERDYYRAGNID